MSVTINGTNGLTFSDSSTQNTAATGFGFKNRIINGAMMIVQRNAGASVTQTTSAVYPVDRTYVAGSVTSKFTAQQNAGSVTPPAGFVKYLGCTSSAATSLGATDYYIVCQIIEGNNISDLAWGTASAATVTLSFWVRSSLTGTFGGALSNGALNRYYAFSYTISAANTWEQKTITIAGDTSGTWATDNTAGLYVNWSLGTGSTYSIAAGSWGSTLAFSATGATSVVGTNGATFYITGVQLEKGSTATSFDYRPYGTELALCQRYCQWLPFDMSGYQAAGGSIIQAVPYKVTMRAVPSFASLTADPDCAQAVLNNASNAFNAANSGVDGACAVLTANAAGTVRAYGYRSLTTAEL